MSLTGILNLQALNKRHWPVACSTISKHRTYARLKTCIPWLLSARAYINPGILDRKRSSIPGFVFLVFTSSRWRFEVKTKIA
ncbi:MAG: hypothetical protein HYR67_13765 [Bacteroidetes bacterium]|nr:hypothetical protein [Bacteroidota bacterium]